ncbi:flagellar hook assembly protein FlgD [Quadrisphaera sp. GCM10027208]|uniref:flagellar hook assembly protein FlgD n=1 Tax=Quadrisphaera sp. GCM10027208 TaxID=3273423 RepID=UPI0036186BE5
MIESSTAVPAALAVTAASSAPAAPAAKPDDLGQDAFLQLLVAQLRYQDPLNPASSTEFLAQTAQFTMVETLEEMASTNAELLSANRMLGASSLVGREVTYHDDAVGEVSGTVSGARFDAAGAVLTIGDVQVPMARVTAIGAATGTPPQV